MSKFASNPRSKTCNYNACIRLHQQGDPCAINNDGSSRAMNHDSSDVTSNWGSFLIDEEQLQVCSN